MFLCLHFEIILFRLFNSLSLKNKIWNFSLRHNMHLLLAGEYALAFPFMYHLNDISCLSFFLSHTYFESLVLSFLVSYLKEFLRVFNPILRGRGVDCGVHRYKHLWIFQKRLTIRIWDFLNFNIYYLGPFYQNFRSVSLFLRKLEPFCRGWLETFCLVAKIQHFFTISVFEFCQTKYTMDAVLLCQQDLW